MNGLYEEAKIAAHAVWRQRRLALAVAWGIAILGWLVIALIPNAYESVARVQVQNKSLLNDTVGISAGDQQGDLDQVRSALLSADNLEKVVLATDLNDSAGGSGMADATDMLRKAILVKALPDNLFEISARLSGGGRSDAANARIARQVVEQLFILFAGENVTGARAEAGATLTFLNQELARRAAQLSEAEQKRVAFQQRYMGLLPGVGSFEQRAEAARVELNQISGDLIAARSAAAALSGQMAATPATIPAPYYGGNGGVVVPGGARARIAALEAQLSDAAARGWTDAHPDVIAAHAQIARLRADAARETTGGGMAAGTTQNPAYASLRSMQAERQATVAEMSSRAAQLQADMTAFTAKQASEPGVAAEQDRLNRDYDVLKAQYDKLLQDREQIQLRSDVSMKADAVRVQVMDPPSAPRVPVTPKRPLLLIGVLVVALGAGIAVDFAKGQLTVTYPTAAKLAASTGLPVLGAVSERVTPMQAAARRRSARHFAGGVAGLFLGLFLLLTIEFIQRGLVA